MKTQIMYVENKATGEARIGRVKFSKTWKTVSYNDRSFLRAGGAAIGGNYIDVETGEAYWISGCKKRGGDAHWASPVKVHIDEDVQAEYWAQIRSG